MRNVGAKNRREITAMHEHIYVRNPPFLVVFLGPMNGMVPGYTVAQMRPMTNFRNSERNRNPLNDAQSVAHPIARRL